MPDHKPQITLGPGDQIELYVKDYPDESAEVDVASSENSFDNCR